MFYLCPQLRLYFHDGNGHPLVGGKLKTFVSNSTIPIRTVRNAEGTVLNPTEITLDERGECTVFLTEGVIYRFELYDSDGALVLEQDGISVASGSGSGGSSTTIAVESGSDGIDVQQTIMDSGVVLYTISAKKIEDAIEAEKNRAESAERALSKSIADETERAIAAEKASRTEIVAGDNITVDKTTGEDGHDIYTINGEKGGSSDNDKVAVESGKTAGYLKDVLVSASDMVTLVPSGNQLRLNFDLTLPSDVVRDSAYKHIDAATANPLKDGTAAVGVSTKYAREDHVHPTDTSRASASHTHGNIANGGTLQTNDITIANGDKLVVTDSSDSSKVARASIAFDGSTTTQALTKAGTWATFNNYSHPAGSAPSKTGVPTANATPGFGGTFKVNQITTDATSHVSAVTERTITIPNTTASTSEAGLMSAADKKKLDGISTGAEANVQADWNITNSSSDAFIKNKPYYTKYTTTSTYYKVCSFPKTSSDSVDISGLQILARYSAGGINGRLIYKNGFSLYYERVSDVYANNQFVKFHYVTNGSKIDLYAQRDGYPTLHVAPLVNQPKSRVDFTDFGTDVSSLPEGATEIKPVWVANSGRSSGTAPVKVNAFGDLTPIPMDSIPTASSTNLMTSGSIKTALDNAVAEVNMRYPFGVHQNRTTSYGYRLFNVKFNTAQSATKVRISGNIVVGTTGNNEHISFDLVIANLNTVENNPSSIDLLTTSTRRGSRVVRLAYKRPSNWGDGLDVFILWNAEGTATAANYTYGWEITQQEATKPSGVEVKDENLTSALTGFTLDSPRTFAITEGTSAIGSTSVPVYANVNGVITPCTDDFVHDGDVTSTYSSTGTAPVNGTAVAAAIGGLDVSSVGGDGKYISAISETDGKISAAATTMDTTPTANSMKAVTSEGIKTAIDTIDAKGITIKEISGEQVICFE